MRNLRSASFSSQYEASQQQAQLSSLLSSSGAGANYPQPELSDTISVVSSLLTDEYKPFKPTNKAPLNQSVATASADQIDSSFSENDRREMENLRAIIKEYKAKKLVLDYEISQKENNIKTLKENNTELKSEADESFAVWNVTRQDTLDFISEDITASYDFGDLSLSEEGGNERDLLWRKLKHYRTIYCKIMQYVEVRESEIKQLENEEKNDFDDIVKLNKSIDADIEHLIGKRAEMESRIESSFNTIIEKKRDNELKRQNIEILKEKVSQAEIKTQQDVQILAKKLFK
ncbi:predicted protein [Naegleria gruberi]|uniref:Predicted protein n=1 Tax=Naegleria gruberi TaxID=5762 RepID=D2VWJ0_NAEGR|nr:uncharacterized protein NAEGRDRAFT_73397 [Naegleria gruberi]EFC38848.1 predicted protein [Naegleria gruberi]|eukprot:XP_002671592.1 predicted protein [Naegleria gruberi strain NEG-M]